jgi:ribonuclease BN (tRNA processing enzyme)
MMEITIIGSGTCVPSLRRSSPCILVDAGSIKILLDSGPGSLRQMLRAGITINDIDLIIYSHFHVDHTADMAPFIFASMYAPESFRTRDLTILGPVGLKEFYRCLTLAYGKWIIPEHYNIDWIEVGKDTMEFTSSVVKTIPTQHSGNSLATRIESSIGHAVVYSGDSEYCTNLVEISRNADLLILECSFPEDMPCAGHLTPSLAGRIARESQCKKLLLTHFYPPCDSSDLLAPLRKKYPGEVLLAEDLMKVRLS